MKHFDTMLTAAAMVAIAGMSWPDAVAAEVSGRNGVSSVDKMRQTVQPVRPFRGQRPWGSPTTDLNAKLNHGPMRSAADAPAMQFEELSRYDFLEGPGGTTWFYTSEYEIETVVHDEYWKEDYIVGYTFTIYDASFQEVGKIKDKVTLAEGETSVALAMLDPAVSAKFFNEDDRIEALVYLAMRTGAENNYKIHYYNKAYSIGGEKDAEGNDVCIAVVPGRCADVLNSEAGVGGERFFYTFVEDIYPDPDEFGPDEYLDYLNEAKTQVSIYAREDGAAGPSVIFSKDVYMTRYPGDTTDGIYMISKTEGGTPYFVFSQYEKPYFVDPTGFAKDENATEDNSLVIEVYAYGNTMSAVSVTKIPVEIKKVEGEINYTFYSIGSVAWKDDIDMSVNGTPEAPAFLVARDYTKASTLEEVASSYDIYGNDGRWLLNLAENSDGIALLAAIEGQQPQVLHVGFGADGQYVFSFVDLYSGEKVLTLPQEFGGDPLTASCQRVPTGDGSYKYVFELQYDGQDAEGNDLKRLAWIGKDGSLERIDRVNMGKGIMAASVNMYAEALSPYLYDTDDAMEYAVLVKRASGNTTKTEFLVVDDNGEWYARFSDEDGKGNPMMFSIVPGADKNRLQMIYVTDSYTYNMDIYDLPFGSGASLGKEVSADALGAAVSFSGTSISAPDARIEVYNAIGVRVAAGIGSVSLRSLARGSYVAVVRDAQGNASTLKVAL